MPTATIRRTAALVSVAALTDLREGARHVLAPDGAVARAIEALVQTGLNAYAVVSVAMWTIVLCVTARGSCSRVNEILD
jgi:hypothetical protein